MPDTTPGPTLVTGATGDIGSALTELLSRTDHPFRVMCRRPDQLEAFRSRGIDAVRGDFTDPAGVRAAMSGCGQVFLLPAVTPRMHEQDRRTIDAARDLGIRQVVKISGADANPRSPVPWAADHGRSDAYLRDSGIAWTTLRPGCFTTNLLQTASAVRRGVLPGTSGRGATTWVDPTDVAAAAARVLTDPATQGGAGPAGRSYLLTGTPPLSFPDVAALLSEALHRRIRYLHLPGPVMYLGLRVAGESHWTAAGLVHQFAEVVRHGLDGVRTFATDLTDLIGRPAVDIAAFAGAHRADLLSEPGRTHLVRNRPTAVRAGTPVSSPERRRRVRPGPR